MMQIPIGLVVLPSIVFAAVCLWFAIDAFTSLADIADPEEASGARSFALFWSFLTGVGVMLSLVMWRIARAQMKGKDA